MTDPTDALTAAVRDELVQLWGDLTQAVRDAHNGCWSAGCENDADRIVTLSRLVGACPWGAVDVALLRSGVYERVHRDAGIDFPPIDWEQVADCERRIAGGVA